MDYRNKQSASSLSMLALYDEDPSTLAQSIVAFLNTYVGPPFHSAQRTSSALDLLRPLSRNIEGVVSIFLRRFWRTFLNLASQVPHVHEAQQKLVLLLKDLNSYSRPNEPQVKFWNGLPGLQSAINDCWQEPTPYEEDYTPYERWVNLHSFASRLYGINLLSGYKLAIKALRRALEDNESQDNMTKRCRIKSAAQWMLYSAGVLFTLMYSRPTENDRQELQSWRFTGRDVFSVNRWNFWKERFTYYGTAIGGEAVAAANSMSRIDGSRPMQGLGALPYSNY
ncbi:hypothetical protein F4774DRAFT_425151 [Daldinia eschscholtzii]|nr:hypothetical protein F4774DRAFT_425151 [Daldinia eschscholtzii]